MKIYCSAFAILLGISSSIAESSDVRPKFALDMTLSRTRLLTLEPIQALVTLRNKSEEVQAVTSSFFGSAIYYHREGETEWQLYNPPGLQPAPPPPRRIVLQPGEVMINYYAFLDVQSSGAPLFNQPGEYWLKAVFHELFIESLPQKVRVAAPTGRDVEAYNHLREHNLARYLTLKPGGLITLARKSDNPIQELKEFVAKYNESIYADYAILAIGLLNGYGLTTERNVLQSETHFRKVTKGKNAVAAEWAYYYLMESSMKKGDMQGAAGFRDRILAETKNPVLKAMSERDCKISHYQSPKQ
jgi:hypothetical protein